MAGITRCTLSTSIQASFGVPDDPDYVFEITAKTDGSGGPRVFRRRVAEKLCLDASVACIVGDNSIMGVSLSTNAIKLYAPATGQYLGDCLGHSNTISNIAYPDPSSPYFLCSSSADGTIRAWDIRERKQVATLGAPSQELWSFDFGGSSGNVAAAGANAQVICWDWRTKRQLACLEECHTEPVTQVRFHPNKKEKLVSASVDGLMCIFDTKGDINDDEGMESVMSVGTSVSKIGFFGRSYEKLWCQTHIETLSIWNSEEAMLEADFTDTRSKASCNWTLSPVEYLIHCHYAAASDSLWLVAGNQEGTVGYFPVNALSQGNGTTSVGAVGPASAVLEGGHTGVVRSVWSPHDVGTSVGALPGLFCWTGGEDGRLCSWTENENVNGRSSAWVSSGLVIRKANRSKQRRGPY